MGGFSKLLFFSLPAFSCQIFISPSAILFITKQLSWKRLRLFSNKFRLCCQGKNYGSFYLYTRFVINHYAEKRPIRHLDTKKPKKLSHWLNDKVTCEISWFCSKGFHKNNIRQKAGRCCCGWKLFRYHRKSDAINSGDLDVGAPSWKHKNLFHIIKHSTRFNKNVNDVHENSIFVNILFDFFFITILFTFCFHNILCWVSNVPELIVIW